MDEAFIEWAASYDDGGGEGRSHRLHEDWLSVRSCPVVRIDGTPTIEESLRTVVDACESDRS